ncbi:MAG: hypothetical protein KY456_13545 [Chloroflexi bacterium]|nr:hypothetical protein [Chloroflexota bacterium]
MTHSAFDAFTRRTAGISRRRSLMTLGGAGLAAALGGPLGTEAKKNKNKNAKKKAKKQAKKKCQQQVPQCETALAQAQALDGFYCCQFLSTCDAAGFIQCLANVSTN